jgi:hypothetical protein
MQKFIPLFPLEIVVYPKEKLNLHIFEPRYIQLIKDVSERSGTFAIPVFMNNQVAEYATEMELLSIEKSYADGKMDIKTKGKRVVRILHFMKEVEQKPYSAGIVSELDTEVDTDLPLNPFLKEQLEKLQSMLAVKKPLFPSYEGLSSYEIAHYIGFSLEDKYHLLTIPTEKQRQGMIFQHLVKALPGIKQNVDVLNRIQMNGHFREEMPPDISGI